ncbi:MAG: ribbon-helix-helix domain-containing protein [Vulcanococcus sp.]
MARPTPSQRETSPAWSASWLWSARNPRSRAACHPSTLSRPAITGPLSRGSPGFPRVSLKQEKRKVKSTKRITITIPDATLTKLLARSSSEGRSLSNLAAYILERGVDQ